MPKGSGGGGNNIFTSSIKGPPPGPLTVGSSAYVELGVIPLGYILWWGNAIYTSPDKSISFEIRSNFTGFSDGTDANTEFFCKTSVSTKTYTVFADYYKNGRTYFASVVSTGVEKFWLKLTSRSSTQANYNYTINYTLV